MSFLLTADSAFPLLVKATNLHPDFRLEFKDWLTKIDGFLQGGASFKCESHGGALALCGPKRAVKQCASESESDPNEESDVSVDKDDSDEWSGDDQPLALAQQAHSETDGIGGAQALYQGQRVKVDWGADE